MGINLDTLPLAALEDMQFGHALERVLCEILLSIPNHGPVQLNKIDLSDRFYHVDINTDGVPNLGIFFPTKPRTNTMVALPIVFPMGWKNSPTVFYTAT